MEFHAIYELFKDTLVVFQSSQNWWVMYSSLAIRKSTYFIQDFHGTSSPYKGMDWFREERRKTKPVRQSFKHQRILLEMTRSTLHNSLHDQNAENWVRLSKAQDQGSRHDTGRLHWSCDFSEWRSSEFWRLGTPIPAPKVTVKKNWQSPQQQQHSTSDTDVPSLWKQRTKREDQAGVQDVTDHSTEADFATRKLGHNTSKMDVDTHLSNKEVSANALLKNEAVKDELTETNIKAIEIIKVGQTKFVFAKIWRRRRCCLVKNPAKLFSRWVRWSSLNWRHPEIDAHHVYTTFPKEQFFAHAASTSDPTKKWYDVSKQIFKFSKHPTSVRLWLLHKNGLIYGRIVTTKHKTHHGYEKGPKKFYVDLW